MHLQYNGAMLCIICESFAKIKYTAKINNLLVLPIQLFESTEWMRSTQTEHNKQNVPLSLCTIQAVFTAFGKQRRLGRRKNL
jgi:3-isopropylmalate dehydratase small subunit